VAGLRDERREIVRLGYDEAGAAYLRARPDDGLDMSLVAELCQRLPKGARVIDVGCGAGVPVAQHIADAGHYVFGIDLSWAQLTLSREHVPGLYVAEADMAALPIGPGTFDGLVSYYAVIHVPREDHVAVFAEFRRVVRAGGWALLCLGSEDNPADRDMDSWLGAPMYWSHYDADTTLRLLVAVGYSITLSWEIPDPMGHGGAHTFVLAQRDDNPEP
jgi:SAM-dependent methyltransferase